MKCPTTNEECQYAVKIKHRVAALNIDEFWIEEDGCMLTLQGPEPHVRIVTCFGECIMEELI